MNISLRYVVICVTFLATSGSSTYPFVLSSRLHRGVCNVVSSDVILVGAAPSGTIVSMLYRYSNCLVPHTRVQRCHYPTYDKRACQRAGGGGNGGGCSGRVPAAGRRWCRR